MKRHGILNSDISSVLSYMGHTDRICIADCGLPIPEETERIDLAVKFGQPTFMELLKVVGDDMKIEKIVLAEEIKENNPKVLAEINDYFVGQEVEVEFVSHVELKEMTKECKAVIRTGETTPYANIILQSGCIF
ncbi:D-ribose pyranase [Intestinibacter sp.]|uniref:D-ribose pyranase n=1 Tax=Intestinibacter sp. TaxID=1965304 RepID=UPI002A754AE5|nr:D-ribose pyranase [Intestinibacter sp.]MDY2735151.1 D-ribose pyranase [Intestinibacter sp.]MDY4574869.1 D-ribose pyranase [Intestinibacter sp.]